MIVLITCTNFVKDSIIGPDHVCKQYKGELEKDYFQCIDQLFCIPKRYRWDQLKFVHELINYIKAYKVIMHSDFISV